MCSSRNSVFERSVVLSFVLVDVSTQEPRLGRISGASVTLGVTDEGHAYARAVIKRGWAERCDDIEFVGPVQSSIVRDITLEPDAVKLCGDVVCLRGVPSGCGHFGCGAAVFSPSGRPAYASSSVAALLARSIFFLSLGAPPCEYDDVQMDVDVLGWRCRMKFPLADAVGVEHLDRGVDSGALAVLSPWDNDCSRAACLTHGAAISVPDYALRTCLGPDGRLRHVLGEPDPRGEDYDLELIDLGAGPGEAPPPYVEGPVDPPPTSPPACDDVMGELDRALDGARLSEDGDDRRSGGWPVGSVPAAWAASVRGMMGRGGRDDVRLWRVAGADGIFELIEGLRLIGLSRAGSSGRRFGWLTRDQAELVYGRLCFLGKTPDHNVPMECCGLLLSDEWFRVLRVFCAWAGRIVSGRSWWAVWLPAVLSALGSDHERATALVTFAGLLSPSLLLPCPRPLMRVVSTCDSSSSVRAFYEWLLPDDVMPPQLSS